jgi:hypothetical protein
VKLQPEVGFGDDEVAQLRTFAEFAEREKGVLARGLLADFVLIDRDLTRIPPQSIRDARVVVTVVGGRVVFERDELRSERSPRPPP